MNFDKLMYPCNQNPKSLSRYRSYFGQKQYELVELDCHGLASKNMFHITIYLAILDEQEETYIVGIANLNAYVGSR